LTAGPVALLVALGVVVVVVGAVVVGGVVVDGAVVDGGVVVDGAVVDGTDVLVERGRVVVGLLGVVVGAVVAEPVFFPAGGPAATGALDVTWLEVPSEPIVNGAEWV